MFFDVFGPVQICWDALGRVGKQMEGFAKFGSLEISVVFLEYFRYC